MKPKTRREKRMNGQISVMDGSGDTKITWNPKNPDDVATARRMFQDLRAKGYMAYKPKRGGAGDMLTSFDPAAKQIVMAPPMVGG